MQAFEELLYLHPASVVARVAEPSAPRGRRTKKPKPVAPDAAPDRRQLLRRLQIRRAAI
jgi:hypothetical protein